MDQIQNLLITIVPFVLIFAVMYFLMIRPEKKRQQTTLAMQNNIQKNDKVVTIGGMFGIVDDIKDDVVTLLTAGGQRIKFEKSAIKRVIKE